MVDLRDRFGDENIKISKQWLDDLKDYQIKILLLTSILAENNLAFRGNLKTMCEWLNIKSCTINNKKIKQTLQKLSKEGYIFYKVEGYTYHVSISNKGMRDKKIYKIRKIWIEAFKNYNKNEDGSLIDNHFSVDWIKILKVFIYIYWQLKPYETVTYKKIALELNVSQETVRKSVIAILKCDLKGISLDKRIIKEKHLDANKETYWRTKGSQYSVMISFSD